MHPDLDEEKFWQKLKRAATKAGRETVLTALKLYYVLLDSDTPAWAKTVIVGALAYFILPTDLLPDFMPGGYVDDFGTLLAALTSLTGSIKPEHEEQAESKLLDWFGEDNND